MRGSHATLPVAVAIARPVDGQGGFSFAGEPTLDTLAVLTPAIIGLVVLLGLITVGLLIVGLPGQGLGG
jgi:hypothetical protein